MDGAFLVYYCMASAYSYQRTEKLKSRKTLDEIFSVGKSFSVFPLMAVEMIAVGEEGGNLEYMLEQVNRIYNNEVKHDLGMFLAVIEPMITVLLVAVIAVLAVAILLPVLSMNSQISPTG